MVRFVVFFHLLGVGQNRLHVGPNRGALLIRRLDFVQDVVHVSGHHPLHQIEVPVPHMTSHLGAEGHCRGAHARHDDDRAEDQPLLREPF